MVLMKQLSHMKLPETSEQMMLTDNSSSSDKDPMSFYLNTFKFNQMENSYTWDDGKLLILFSY